ncbi:hypothetical protein D3C84_354910 [compost metagenome]
METSSVVMHQAKQPAMSLSKRWVSQLFPSFCQSKGGCPSFSGFRPSIDKAPGWCLVFCAARLRDLEGL